MRVNRKAKVILRNCGNLAINSWRRNTVSNMDGQNIPINRGT